MKSNNVKINLFPYSNIPCVHGFKLANGSMYIAFASWDEKLKIIQPNNAVFVHIEGNDNSKQATQLKVLFENWLVKTKSYVKNYSQQ